MDTVYVLMELGWDYNDETFFNPESGGGSPHSFFLNEEDAKRECDVLNVAKFKELWEHGEIKQYCYNFDELIYLKDKDQDSLDAICVKIFGKNFRELEQALDEDEDSAEFLSSSHEDWKHFISHFNMTFWEVVPVERG